MGFERISRRPRILLCETNEDGTVGGSHQALYDLVLRIDRGTFEPVVLYYQDNRFVAGLRRMQVEVHVWEEQRRVERARRRRDRSLMGRASTALAEIRARARFLRRQRIDLLHMNNTPTKGYGNWLPAAVIARVPAISNEMGLPEFLGNPLRRWLSRRWKRVIAISDHVEQRLLDLGYPPEAVCKATLGIDSGAFSGAVVRCRDHVRADLGVAPHEIMVTMVGHIRSWKGQHLLVAALEELPEAVRGRLRVFFVGGVSLYDGQYYRSVSETVDRAAFADRVRFLGERWDVPDLLNATDIAVHASVLPEPFGLVVLEAMAAGKPLIAADSGGPLEILTPGSGLTFDTDRPQELAGHLVRLVDDPRLRAAIGRAGQERAELFSLAPRVAAVQDLYAELLS